MPTHIETRVTRPPLTEPTAHRIDCATGTLTGRTGAYEKRLEDLDGLYADAPAFAAARAATPGRIVYRVEDVRPSEARGGLIFGTTHMAPGRIGDEFFMTRGHIHARADRPETYYGESGHGLMLLESPEGETRLLEVLPKVIAHVPPFWIHRSINIGATPLVMSFCYPADAGQDYSLIERSGGMALRVLARPDGSHGWHAVANPAYRPRSSDAVAAIYADKD